MCDKKHVCAQCKNPASLRCTGCQKIYYCSHEHQRSHWKIHARICRTYKMAENEKLGRHYVATRNIKVGEVVMYEKPLLTSFRSAIPVCLGCHDVFSKDDMKPCGNCGWPLCPKCIEHAGAECEFTKKHRKINIIECGVPDEAYEAIPLVQALALRENDPKAYGRLMRLKDHCFGTAIRPSVWKTHDELALFVNNYYDIKDVDEAEMAKIVGIIKINAFMLKDTDVLMEFSILEQSSYIEHNCRANCSTTGTGTGGLVIWAAMPISKGDHISINYAYGDWGTLRRKAHLYKTKCFDCTCERCSDPTEFGTMFSAFRCPKETCRGFILQRTSIPSCKEPAFACYECKETMPFATIAYAEREMYTMIKGIQTKFSLSRLHEAQALFAKHAKILHENHFYKVSLDSEELMRFFGDIKKVAPHMSTELLNDRIKRCEKLIKLYRILHPSEHEHRGILYFLLFNAKALLEHRKQPDVDILSESPQCYLGLKWILERAYALLHREPPSRRGEHNIANVCLQQIQILEAIEK